MNRFQIAWIVWVLWFIVWEWIAVTNDRPNDTLSEQIWLLIGTGSERSGLNWFFRIGLAAGIAWMIPHFMTGWKWFSKGKRG